jgi:hypothetical protein
LGHALIARRLTTTQNFLSNGKPVVSDEGARPYL